MATRHQVVRVNGHARGVLDALGGRTIRMIEPPPGRGVVEARIFESGKRIFLQCAVEDDGTVEIKDIFPTVLQAIVYWIGEEISTEVLNHLTDEEREAALEAAFAAQRRGEPGLLGIHEWARARFGKDLVAVMQERTETPRSDDAQPFIAPASKMVH